MSATDTDSMASHVALLSSSFQLVPPAAIPAMLDCILASTDVSPMSLYSALLDAFPNVGKDILKEDGRLDSGKCNYIGSFVSSLCHLLKKIGHNDDALKSFIWRCFLPLMKMVHGYDYEILNQTTELLFDAVIATNTWGVLEATVVPFFLRLVGLSMGMHQNDELAIYEWTKHAYFHDLDNQPNHVEMDNESMVALSLPFPLPISCHILSLILSAALRSHQAASTSESTSANEWCYAEKIAGSLLWDLCNMTLRLLSQSLDHRSCAISFLIPCTFKAFVSQCSFAISSHEKNCVLSRKQFFIRIWKCCKTLFSLGTLERRDAYTVLSQYLSFFLCTEECEDAEMTDRTEEFDIRAEKEFWDEIKKGLVDKEGLVRKQSLHILKTTLHINGRSQCNSGVSENILTEKDSIPQGMTKKGMWADKEANSLGVGKVSNSVAPCLSSLQRWEAFLLLYEMLEEYGTHLVEAAWNHQINLLLHSPTTNRNSVINNGRVHQNQMETLGEIFDWLRILWERGFYHDNPQVRCLIMQSFLGIEWKIHENYTKSVPESFVLGPFIQGLNDPVHHQDFGVKGIYTSKTIEGATRFLCQFTRHLNVRKHISFLSDLAYAAKQHSFGRAGLMGLAECIASAACGVQIWHSDAFHDMVQVASPEEFLLQNSITDFLDVLRFVIESSKQHFNLKYRLQVCKKILEAAASMVCTMDVSLEILLLFITALPREFIDCGGSLRIEVQKWLLGCGRKHRIDNCCCNKMKLMENLYDFPIRFISQRCMFNASNNYDDEDLDAWDFKAKQWARVVFLVLEEHQLEPLLMFIQNYGINVCQQNDQPEWIPVRFLILMLSLVQELQILQEKTADQGRKFNRKSESGLVEGANQLGFTEASIIYKKFAKSFLFILEELVAFSQFSCSIFLSTTMIEDTNLPCSIRGRLGGPSQRRLPSTTTTAVLQAITSMKTVASISSWCAQFKGYASLKFSFTFLWNIFQKIDLSSTCNSETEAEICLAAYETLACVLKPVVSASSPIELDLIKNDDNLWLPNVEGKHVLDSMVLTFLENISNLLAVGVLARSRRAVLMNWKWLCLESLLSIPYHALENEVHRFFSDAAVRRIFCDIVQSLENAGEESVLPMLRSIRFVLGLLASGSLSVVSSCDGIDSQMMWDLVHSSWILHVNCNKRRVAPIAALLSSILHSSVFQNESLHVIGNEPGPLKWFIEKVLEEGTKSPRTIRLAALHLTGQWLLYPKTIKYYMKELKLLSLYGSVAFDEDFEAEVAENHDAKIEVSCLANSPDPELTETYLNTELYARVSVAALFYKLADMADVVGSVAENENCCAALESGKLFLLELLDAAVNDKDLSKELYKKYSAIHRRKIRVWQMICVLSRFIDQDIVQQVASSLHICLYRNNLPAVRQYLETFAIHIYLKFPSLVGEQLVQILRDYEMKPQALSSYVFIAANVILHASDAVQSSHLDELLPPIVPLLTSHHHSLRGFTQLLVYQVLSKLFPLSEGSDSEIMPLEKRCFVDLKSYLGKNSDCARLRASMEGFLDAFDPKNSATPSGIFTNRVEELEFECVPASLMDQVLTFLNDVRDGLRCSMAKDAVTILNESLRIGEHATRLDPSNELVYTQLPKDITFDFQKKITLSKHEVQGTDFTLFMGNKESYKPFMEMEKEDLLLDQLLQSRSLAMKNIRAGRQQFVLVASLLDRIPNLAGLARTCEVFKAAGLAIADANILHDKQFQLISVTAEKWVPIIEVPVNSVKVFLEKKKREGFSILGLEQTANSIPLDQYNFPKKMVLLLGHEKEGIPVDIIHILDACIEIPQLGVVRSLNVHVSGAIALWEYTRQQRSE